jgi:hypothetical protein
MQDRGESIATADFPELPGLADLQSWPAASVPASVLNEARAGAVAVPLDVIQRSNPPVLRPDGSADLFLDDPVVPRSAVPAPVLPDPEQEFLQYRDVTVPENAAAVPTGIRLRPGDDFELDAGGRIWAGVPFTGENGPNGWDRIEYDRKFFLTGQPNGHPFCLLGQLGRDGAYFFIGEHRDRQRYRGEETYELFLRVNDDAPGNGSGAFQCRVKTWGQPLTISHRMIDFGDAAVCGSNEQALIIEIGIGRDVGFIGGGAAVTFLTRRGFAVGQAHKLVLGTVALHLIDSGGQTINTKSPMGHMMLTVMAGRAELERNLIAERTDKGHLTAIR